VKTNEALKKYYRNKPKLAKEVLRVFEGYNKEIEER
jgi:hypothetical protein